VRPGRRRWRERSARKQGTCRSGHQWRKERESSRIIVPEPAELAAAAPASGPFEGLLG